MKKVTIPQGIATAVGVALFMAFSIGAVAVSNPFDITTTLLTKVMNTFLELSRGNVAGKSSINKFGNAPDFDQDDGEVTIWDNAEDAHAWQNMRYDYSTTADIDSVISQVNSDTNDIEIQGLDANSNLVVQTVTLNGTNRVALATNLYRVFRAKNEGSVTNAGHVFIYTTNGTTTAGVPDNGDAIRALVHEENQQTEMALYTVPKGKTAYMVSFYAGTAGATKNSEYIIRVYARKPNGVFQLKHRSALADVGGIHFQHDYKVYPAYTEGTDIEMTVEIPAGTADAASVSAGFDLILCDN